jgi:hypothetical protein
MIGTTIANNDIGQDFSLRQALQYDEDDKILSFLQSICEKRSCSMADLNA